MTRHGLEVGEKQEIGNATSRYHNRVPTHHESEDVIATVYVIEHVARETALVM